MSFGDQTAEIAEILIRFGVPQKVAKDVVQNELRHWSPQHIAQVFGQLSAERLPLTPLMGGPVEYIKPPLSLLRQSAREKKALCINSYGDWSLQSSGYSAISHVWSEGLVATEEGFSRAQLNRLFQTLRRAGLHPEYLWIDTLALPTHGPHLSVEQEELKVEVINTLADVYDHAETVIILDALLLRMQATNLDHIAVGLVCGAWMTRVWTYQEIKLARKAILVTATSHVDYDMFLEYLRNRSQHFADRYQEFYKTFNRLKRYDELGVSLPDIALSSGLREAGHLVDHARGFFACLGLKWKAGWGIEEGMAEIYRSQPRHASRLALMHGISRLTSYYAWAPSRLTGIEGTIIAPMDIEQRGLRGDWSIGRVTRLRRQNVVQGRKFIEVDLHGDDRSCTMTCCFLLSPDENDTVLDDFRKAIEQGIAYAIWKGSDYGPPTTVILVEAALDTSENTSLEFYVHCTALIHIVRHDPGFAAVKRSVLLRHHHPQASSGIGRAVASILFENDPKPTEGESPLHIATRSGEISIVQQLLATRDLLCAKNLRGWIPLHTAACVGHWEIAKILLDAGTPIDYIDKENRTPLYVAVEYEQLRVAQLLLESKADPNKLCPGGPRVWTALAAAARSGNLELVELLLKYGARVNDDRGQPALLCAAGAGRTLVTQLLLEHGASTNLVLGPARKTALHVATIEGHSDIVGLLIAFGADVNARKLSNKEFYVPANIHTRYWTTALHCALANQHEPIAQRLISDNALLQHPEFSIQPLHYAAQHGLLSAARMLLVKGVNVDDITLDENPGLTPLYLASKNGKHIMVKLLLEWAPHVDKKCGDFGTALSAAVSGGHDIVVRNLIRAGARVLPAMIDAALESGNEKVIDILLQVYEGRG